ERFAGRTRHLAPRVFRQRVGGGGSQRRAGAERAGKRNAAAQHRATIEQTVAGDRLQSIKIGRVAATLAHYAPPSGTGVSAPLYDDVEKVCSRPTRLSRPACLLRPPLSRGRADLNSSAPRRS